MNTGYYFTFDTSFFTPFRFEGEKTLYQNIQEAVDDYFYLDGKVVSVIPPQIPGTAPQFAIKNSDQSKNTKMFLGAIKIISYMTIIIPLIMLIAKVAFRPSFPVYKQNSVDNSTNTAQQQKISTTAAETILSKNSNKKQTSTNEATKTETKPPIADNSSAKTVNLNSVATLMDSFTKAWDSEIRNFKFPENSFDIEKFAKDFSAHAQKFKNATFDINEHFGFIDKFDLSPADNPQIYIRADLHGDLKSFIENLRTLQAEGLLDENFKCKTGIHLVFLGDYCDRGIYGTQVLEMLMRLREENPTQVHLIRGNHEYLYTNSCYGQSDVNLMSVLNNVDASKALNEFYQTIPLTTYFSVGLEENREYVQCTHGLFELSMDPAPLLDTTATTAQLCVPIQRKLSERIRKIAADSNSKLYESAKRINDLVLQICQRVEADTTIYNWGDIGKYNYGGPEHLTEMHINNYTYIGSLGNRTFGLSTRDIFHYFQLSSEQHQVKMIFRGHEHAFQHHFLDNKLLVTTLPVGMDTPYKEKFDQPDRAYIIKPDPMVEKWSKRAILRGTGHDKTDEVTAEFPLTSSTI